MTTTIATADISARLRRGLIKAGHKPATDLRSVRLTQAITDTLGETDSTELRELQQRLPVRPRGRQTTGQPVARVRSIGRVSDTEWAIIRDAIAASGATQTAWIVSSLLYAAGSTAPSPSCLRVSQARLRVTAEL